MTFGTMSEDPIPEQGDFADLDLTRLGRFASDALKNWLKTGLVEGPARPMIQAGTCADLSRRAAGPLARGCGVIGAGTDIVGELVGRERSTTALVTGRNGTNREQDI